MSIPLRNTTTRYGLVSQLFHWLVVGLILIQYVWAWRIDQVEGFRARLELVTQHKTIGMVVLVLAVLRLLWRLFNRPPPLPGGLAGWEVLAARVGHGLLYGLIFAIPLSGWLYSSRRAWAISGGDRSTSPVWLKPRSAWKIFSGDSTARLGLPWPPWPRFTWRPPCATISF